MKKLFSLLLNTCILFGACTDDVKDITQNSSTPLGVNVKVNPASRAIVYGTALPSGSSIGINVTAADGSDYDNKTNGYTNIAYTATGEGEKQEWNATTPILLSGAEGKLYAYYPYKEAVDYKAINVDVTEQKDWMYAKDDYTVSDAKANAEITLAHAQTAINVNLVRGTSYTGAGLVEALTVTSEGLADTGKLDARNGTFTSVTAANTAISIIKESFTLDGTIKSSQENPYMIIPASADTKNFTVTATLDGKTYSHEVSMAEPFVPGKVYKVNVTFNNTGLTVSTVSLVDWSETDLGETEFEPGESNTKDPYADYLQLTYNVTDNSTPTQIFYSKSSFDIVSVSEIVVVENDGSRAAAEAVSVTPSKTYQFSKTGIHTVYIKFVDMTNIPNYAFRECTVLEEVSIPKSVITIGKQAFYGCSGLTEVTISNSVTSIGERTFYNCTDLISINIPESVTSIGNYAFAGCNKIERINVEVNNAVFDSRDNCNAVIATATNTLVLGCKSTMIPKSVTLIGEYAFAYCTGLTSITIPTSVKKIGESAFYECTGLTSITIPNSVTSIGTSAFRGCQGLTEITIPESVTKIESGVFMSCKGLTEVTIPNTVTLLDNSSFDSCSGLIEVTIGSGVQFINSSVFSGCTRMQKITIGESVRSIGESAFYRCTGLTTIISLAKTAPNIEKTTFWTVKTNGILYVPTSSSGYDKWTKQGNTSNNEYYLGNYNWTKSYI